MEQVWNRSTLYHNEDCTVFLVDIPASIEEVQSEDSGEQSPRLSKIYSAPSLEQPYPSLEPKSTQVFPQLTHGTNANDQITLLRKSLAEIRQNFHGSSWCLKRQEWRKEALERKSVRDEQLLQSLQAHQNLSLPNPRILPLSGLVCIQNVTEIQNQLVINPHGRTARLQIGSTGTQYLVPPSATFLLSHISFNTSSAFSMAALQAFPGASSNTSAGPAQFDVIVLDPPWPNRSVKRSGHFQSIDDVNLPLEPLAAILGQHIAPGCFVCLWITNKIAVREQALDLLTNWNTVLVEEWTWLKTTNDGEPVVALDGVWRKPFETVLIGQRPLSQKQSTRTNHGCLKRRVMAAVPDLHSRKPNLKDHIEKLLMNPIKEYRSLEIFARNLGKGVFAWGDEALKFNDEQAWCQTQT